MTGFAITSDIKIYAKYLKDHMVLFKNNGNVVNRQKVVDGKKAKFVTTTFDNSFTGIIPITDQIKTYVDN